MTHVINPYTDTLLSRTDVDVGHGSYYYDPMPIFYGTNDDKVFEQYLKAIPKDKVLSYRHRDHPAASIYTLMKMGHQPQKYFDMLRNYIGDEQFNKLKTGSGRN